MKNHYPNCINLDYFGSDLPKYIEEVVRTILHHDSSHPTLLFIYEWTSVEDLFYRIDTISQHCKAHKIIWVLPESIYYNQYSTLLSKNIDFYLIDIDLLSVYFELDLFKASSYNQQWNSTADKFLFLTGKPDKSNRLGLLHKFYQHNLLENCVWSLFMSPTLKTKCRFLLPELTDEQYNKFVDQCVTSPDQMQPDYENNKFFVEGFPYNSDIYQTTLFRVISETQMFDHAITTEKTWTTIVNNQPFIMAGYPGCLRFLKHAGFKTFVEYLPYPEYDEVIDEEIRFEQVILNTEYLMSHIDTHKQQIAEDVKYNYQLIRKKMEVTYKNFFELYQRLDYPQLEIFRIIPLTMLLRNKWITFYYNIKDPTWPDCYAEEHFDLLPDNIKEECINVFGYTPKQKY